MPQMRPPTGQATQNHMAEVPSGVQESMFGAENTGAKRSARPTMVATS